MAKYKNFIVRHMLENLQIKTSFPYRPIDISGSDGDTILINRLKKIGRWKEDKSVREQEQLLNSYLKNPKNKRFLPGSYVLPNISLSGKLGEKGTNLKVFSRH